MPKQGRKFTFRSADGTVKLAGKDHDVGTCELARQQPEHEEDRSARQGETDGPDPAEQQEEHDDLEAGMTSGVSVKIFIYRQHVQHRVKPCVPKERSLPIPVKFFEVVMRKNTTFDVLQERQINDHSHVDGDWELSGPWTGVTSSQG